MRHPDRYSASWNCSDGGWFRWYGAAQHTEVMVLAVIRREVGLLAAHVSDAMPLLKAPGSDVEEAKWAGSLLPLAGMAAGCWGLIVWAVMSVL